MTRGNWEKIGLVFEPERGIDWMQSHASLPVPLHLVGSRYRVYFSSRDATNRSHVGYFELSLDAPREVLELTEDPVLAPGPLGYFDDHGVYAASVERAADGTLHLYTVGWNPGVRPPLFYASIGLAQSSDNGRSFEKVGRSPILARSDHDPCLVTSPVVRREGEQWRMWYVSGTGWIETGSSLSSRYHVKYAESVDGLEWRRDGIVCIDHDDERERNIARCWVVPKEGGYRAWFSSDQGDGYRIRRASSADGITWTREPKAEIEPSPSGWDSEAQAHPAVVFHDGMAFMFYNGNGYGRDGIGLAVRPA